MARFAKKKKNEMEWTWPFPIEEAWNAKDYIAKYVYQRIQALIEIEEKSPFAGFPGVLDKKYGAQGFKIWLKYLGEMEYAFHVFSTKTYWKETKENQERVKRGLHLFAEYYEYLWN